jgi:hypothetical protein
MGEIHPKVNQLIQSRRIGLQEEKEQIKAKP